MRYIIGVDPGLNGALAIIDIQENTLKVTRTPTYDAIMKGKKTAAGKQKTRSEFDIIEMVKLADILPEEVRGVAIEEVTARTGQGVTSMFRFGYGLGIWHGILAAKSLIPLRVRPQTWKSHFNLIGEEKSESITKATELFPACAPYWKLKKDDGLAEATLIAAYMASERGIQLESLTPVDTFDVKRPARRTSKKVS